MSEVVNDVFGNTKDGKKVTRYTLKNSKGVNVKILDYGGVITEINLPDKDGKYADVNLGFDNLTDYETKSPYFGALIGRTANRIAGGHFTLDTETYDLFVNNPAGCLHGGKVGFDKRIWSAEVRDGKLVLKYVSPDLEENFPCELTTTVTYSLDDENNFRIEYEATTDKATILNLTNHAYFNLGGHGTGHINDHIITLHADEILALDENSVPTGDILGVAKTEFDLKSPTCFGDRLNKVPGGKGFDNNFCLNNNGKLVLAARVEHPPSGRMMECYTTEPGLQLYTGFYLAEMAGKGGAAYNKYGALCLEAQHYPDSIHHPHFPNTVLRNGETYSQTTIYKFGLM